MAIHEPEKRQSNGADAPVPQPSEHPITQFQRRMGQLFDDFIGNWGPGWNLPSLDMGGDWLGGFNPRMDVSDDGKEVSITVEVPGIAEKDIEVTLTDNLLTIKGEKRRESEQKGKDFLRRERSYGSFRRSLRVGPEIDASKVKASFKDGVLHVSLPKSPAAQQRTHKIPIQG
jgi:HSP20 family protein